MDRLERNQKRQGYTESWYQDSGHTPRTEEVTGSSVTGP